MISIGISIYTFLILLVQTVLLFVHGYRYFARSHEFRELRFLILTVLFIVYNSINGFNFGLSATVLESISNTSGVLLVSFFFYFIFSQLFTVNEKRFNIALIASGVLITLFLEYILTKGIRLTDDGTNVIIHTVLISLYYFIGIIFSVFNKWMRSKQILSLMSGGFVMLIMIVISSFLFSLENVEINKLAMNLFFLLALIDYFVSNVNSSKLNGVLEQFVVRSENNENTKKLSDYNLTAKELEVAKLVLKGSSYQEIADELNISTGTARKHTSNIFGKTNCLDRHDFVLKSWTEEM